MKKKEFYMKIRRYSLIFDDWAYFDVPDYYADNLFEKHKVAVAFGSEFRNPNSRYRVVCCSTLKLQRKRFVAAMRELPYMMALNGYGDYEDFCVAEVKKINELYAGKKAAK